MISKVPYSAEVRLRFIRMFCVIGLLSTITLVIYFTVFGVESYRFLYWASIFVFPFLSLSIYYGFKKQVTTTAVLAMVGATAGIISAVTLHFTEFLTLMLIFIL